VRYLNALRQAVGLHIDPETAEVDCIYAQTLDPYGDFPNLPEEYQQVGREATFQLQEAGGRTYPFCNLSSFHEHVHVGGCSGHWSPEPR
jgi:hypothetical protein